MTDVISEFLGAAVEEPKEVTTREIEVATGEIEAANKNARFEEASEYVNTNLKVIIDSSMESLPGLFRVMSDSEDPKMYQVGAAFIKTLSEINKTFYEVNKPMGGVQGGGKEEPQTGGQQNIQINNSEVHLVSTKDLLD